MYAIGILALLLALSAAGNVFLWKHGEALKQEMGAVQQLATDAKAAGEACSKGVEDMAKAAGTRQKRLETALAAVAPEVRRAQSDALAALSAKPDNAADLCGSLERYLRSQIKAERGIK